jgi:hypothetical protein
MQSQKLIGWPLASGAFNGGAGSFEIVGKCDLPSVVFRDYTAGNLGDITGKGKGKGAARARAVGVGEDAEFLRAERAADLEERSGWVADLLAQENELGRVLMLLAGGREFLEGRGVRLNGSGMAPRAARYLKDMRGLTPSDTSLEDAAAAAAAELVLQVSIVEYALGLDTLPAARVRADACIRSHLAGCAWRAAFHSLTGDETTGGMSGRESWAETSGVSLALEAGQLEAQRASLEAWARGERLMEDTAETTARRALCSWVWRSLVPGGAARGANGARVRDCARRRARFLIRLIHGQSWADAARLAGFEDGAAASKVLAARHTWAVLGAAAAADAGGHPVAAELRRAWMRAARAEIKARRAARPFMRTSAPCGAVRKVARGLETPGGAVLVREYARDRAPRVSRKIRALAVNIGAAARVAIDKREQAAAGDIRRGGALGIVQVADCGAGSCVSLSSLSIGARR